MKRKRILLFAEAVTLAHVARPFALAGHLDPAEYEVFFASDLRFQHLFAGSKRNKQFEWIVIRSMPAERFLDNLSKARPLFDKKTLRGYVEEEVRLIGRVKPDLVIGDLRLSLSISARRLRVPYVMICNAHWSPFSRSIRPLPELPFLNWMPDSVARWVFDLGWPIAAALHARPLNQLRRQFDLAPINKDLRYLYTSADHVWYPETPNFIETHHRPRSHRYIGPLLWSPETPAPGSWERLSSDRPIVYWNMGTSGKGPQRLLKELAKLPIQILAATTGEPVRESFPENVLLADYLPGSEACARASLAINNGGSASVYQALAVGTPVLGLASNMDQFLTMNYVAEWGAGIVLRAQTATPTELMSSVKDLLEKSFFRKNADRARADFAAYPAGRMVPEAVESIFSGSFLQSESGWRAA